jgi:hypothetical protein
MSKYEQLIEFIINEQEDKARELFHKIVVEKSREIYESLIDEQDLEEVGGDEVESMVDEITSNEEGMHENMDDDMDDDMGDDMGSDMDGMDDMGMDDMDDDESNVEDRVMDLEDALDELKAEFDSLMGQEAGEPGMDDMDDMGGDDFGDEDDKEEFGDDESQMFKEEDEEDDEEDMAESPRVKGRKMTEAEWIREYVEKVGDAFPGNQGNPSGAMVGTGAKSERQGEKNTKSVVAGKNDMGGTTSNIAKGGANADPSGTPSKNPSGLLKQGGEIDVAKRNVNKVGGNKGAQKFYDKQETSYEKAKGAEGQTTGGKVSVDKKSLLKKIGK